MLKEIKLCRQRGKAWTIALMTRNSGNEHLNLQVIGLHIGDAASCTILKRCV